MSDITKRIINAGLTSYFPVIVLSDENSEVILDSADYTAFWINEGMTDAEIMQFAGLV